MPNRTETAALSPAIEAARLPPRARRTVAERTRVLAELHVAQARAETFTALAQARAMELGIDDELGRLIGQALVDHRAGLRLVDKLRRYTSG